MKEIDHTKPKSRKDKIRRWLAIKKPIYKTWWLYPCAILLIVAFVVGIPIAINEAYKVGEGYITVWGGPDILSFYAVVLSGIISITALIVPEPGKLEADETGPIEIIVKNIGDGLALEPSYQVDMFASTVIPDNAIEKGNYIVLSYDFHRNLNDKYVYYHFKDGFDSFKEGLVIHYTRINLCYKNMLGIALQQQILVELHFDFEHKNITVQINALSPQTGLSE